MHAEVRPRQKPCARTETPTLWQTINLFSLQRKRNFIKILRYLKFAEKSSESETFSPEFVLEKTRPLAGDANLARGWCGLYNPRGCHDNRKINKLQTHSL
jgi:hypothetical protein